MSIFINPWFLGNFFLNLLLNLLLGQFLLLLSSLVESLAELFIRVVSILDIISQFIRVVSLSILYLWCQYLNWVINGFVMSRWKWFIKEVLKSHWFSIPNSFLSNSKNSIIDVQFSLHLHVHEIFNTLIFSTLIKELFSVIQVQPGTSV